MKRGADHGAMKAITARLLHASELPPAMRSIIGRCKAFAEAIDSLPEGYLALGRGGEVIDSNREAVELLKCCKHAIELKHGRLVGATAKVQAQIEESLEWCREARGETDDCRSPRPIVFHRRPAHTPVVLCIVPLAGPWLVETPRDTPIAIAWVVDTGTNGREVESVRRIFGLTAAEARVAQALAGGKSLSDAAKAMRITRSTAKSHLDAVFAKTGCRRQAQLVHLMACLRGLA